MKNEKDTTKQRERGEPRERRPYQPPKIEEERTFETAVLGCSGADLNCFVPQSV